MTQIRPYVVLLAMALSWGCSDESQTLDGPGPITSPIDEFPRWSPDGSRMLYYHYGVVSVDGDLPIIDPQERGLWMVRDDGGNPRQLLRGSSIYADWNGTSDSLVYEYGGQIYRAALIDSTLDSLSIVQLTDAGSNYFPAWSSDSRWIAYDSDVGSTGPFEIWIMRADGSEKRRIDRTGMGEWRMPSWSPANAICHIRYPSGTYFSEIFTMSDDGSTPLRITTNDREEGLPRYSPDGSKLAFHSTSDGDFAVWIVNANGTNSSRLTSGWEPCWSPDGEWIAFARASGIWKIRSDGTDLTQVTQGPK